MTTAFTSNPALTENARRIMPYAAFIGLEAGYGERDQLLFSLPFIEQNIGNIFLPALYGGLIGGFLESASCLFLYHSANLSQLPKMVDFSLDYLRSGKPETCYACCVLTRQGHRIANVAAEVWQSDSAKPIATARTHFQMPQT
ncbi:PaaI family thioesterase [Stenoxybacter acetivorans]|uniref:PaaI family thioesterase n=1 Tax=Stenoxybacter acetivorans TaxID=422441 RepID=UPI0005694E95|nr:PaaI family thioesterase [Stenoxybacter acetivorans]